MTQRQFTLIEILVALSIIVILAGSLAVIGPRILKRAKEGRAETQISVIEMAVENFKQDNGYYPSDVGSPWRLDGSDGQTWWAGLTDQQNKAYVDWDSAGFPERNGYRVDPWDNPFYYCSTSGSITHNAGSFDVWSAGPDGTSGTDDDIGNWQ